MVLKPREIRHRETAAPNLNLTGQAQGALGYFNGVNWVVLAAGTDLNILKTQGAGANPAWTDTAPLCEHAKDLQITSEAAGDILYFNGTNWVRLAKGTALQYLRQNAGLTAPEWVDILSSGLEHIYHEENSSATTGEEVTICSKTLTAGDFNGKDTMKIFAHFANVDSNVSTYKVVIFDGTNTYAQDLATAADKRQAVFFGEFRQLEGNYANTKMFGFHSSQSGAHTNGLTLPDFATSQTTMIANWLESALVISLKATVNAATTKATLDIVRIKGE